MSQPRIAPLRRILLATDFSETSDCARDAAKHIAHRTKATIEVVNVSVPMPPLVGDIGLAYVPPPTAEMIAALKERLALWAAQIGPDIRAHVLQEAGPADAIVKFAEAHDFDLIVVGTQGRQGITRFFMGSIASEVVRRSSVSTLVIPPNSHFSDTGPESILAAVDFSPAATSALHQAADLALLRHSRFTALHIVDDRPLPPYFGDDFVAVEQHKAEAELQALIDREGLVTNPAMVVAAGAPHVKINETAAGLDADLIVMGTSGLSGITGFLLGSVTDRVLRTATCAVLAHRSNKLTSL